MKLEDFNALTEEEKATYLSSIETSQKVIDDLTAERDSYKNENDSIMAQLESNNKELKATKELNFTLARKINNAPEQDAETQIFNFMKGF